MVSADESGPYILAGAVGQLYRTMVDLRFPSRNVLERFKRHAKRNRVPASSEETRRNDRNLSIKSDCLIDPLRHT